MASIREKKIPPYCVEDVDDEVGKAKIETQVCVQIKELVKKQLAKSINLHHEVKLVDKFITSELYKPSLEALHGTHSIETLKRIEEEDERVSALKSCGLNDYDIRLKILEDKASAESPYYKQLKINPMVKAEKLHAIEQQISAHQEALKMKHQFRGTVPLTRHEIEIEKSLNKGSQDQKLIPCLFHEKIPDRNSLNAHHLLMSLEKNPYLSTTKKTVNSLSSEKATEDDTQSKNLRIAKKDAVITTGWDVEACAAQLNYPRAIQEIKMAESAACLSDVICGNHKGEMNTKLRNKNRKKGQKSSRFVYTGTNALNSDESLSQQLSLDDIRNIPKFANFSPGTPSENLARCTTRHDLVTLFLRLEKSALSKIVYRLLEGRMRGQAFVTFPDIPTAQKAWSLVNGRILHGKVVLACYSTSRCHRG